MIDLMDNGRSARKTYCKVKPCIILDVVSDHFCVSIQDMKSACRKRTLLRARQTSMYLMTHYTKMSLEQIGNLFGGKDHTTVTHSHQVIQDLIDNESDTSEEMGVLVNKIINMNVYVESESDVRPELAEAVFLLKYLRRSTKSYENTPNYLTRQQKKEWEEKADEFIKKISTK